MVKSNGLIAATPSQIITDETATYIGLVLSFLLIGFFGLRAVRSYWHIHQTGLRPDVTQVELVRGWMTIPYIARAYHVPEAYLFQQLGIPSEGNQTKSLAQLNREYAPGEREVMLNGVKEALRRYQAEHSTPPPRRPGHD